MKYNDTTGKAMRLVSFQQFNRIDLQFVEVSCDTTTETSVIIIIYSSYATLGYERPTPHL
jgi:hypothetical protein